MDQFRYICIPCGAHIAPFLACGKAARTSEPAEFAQPIEKGRRSPVAQPLPGTNPSSSGKKNPLHDRLIPIWQLVYNGIILSNPFTETVNASAKDRFTQTKLAEFNGRPIYYFYSRFKADNKNWMGDIDLACATDEELEQAAAIVKKGHDEFEALADLQLEFMEQHEELAPDVFRTAFSNGAEIISNYRSEPFTYKGKTVEPMGYRRF